MEHERIYGGDRWCLALPSPKLAPPAYFEVIWFKV